MTSNPLHSVFSVFRLIFPLVVVLVGAPLVGCEQSGSTPAATGEGEVFGTAAQGGTAPAGKVWETTLEAWPKQGNLSILFESPSVQAAFENWMREPPKKPGETLVPVIEKVRRYNDALIALDGGWGPLSDSTTVRAMALRGMRKTLWSDLRVSVAEGDTDRVADLIVVMCNLPRVHHGFDGSTRGLLHTVDICNGIWWGMRDARFEGLEFDDAQKARIRAASSWVEDPDALGVVVDPESDPRRVNILKNYRESQLSSIMDERSKLLN